MFWWRGHLDLCDASGYLEDTRVSILVLVERPFGPHIGRVKCRVVSVSILVLVERPFGPVLLNKYVSSPAMFQSLFWWRGHLDGTAWCRVYANWEFQSLFWWRGHLDATPLTLWKAAIRFQSLFWWRGHLDFGETMIRAQAMKFQSLFWWRGHLDGAMLQRPCPTHKVSILVLVERPFGQAARDSPEAINIRFQSLFWWRGHLDPISGCPCPRYPCFNPCFGGEAIWTWNMGCGSGFAR